MASIVATAAAVPVTTSFPATPTATVAVKKHVPSPTASLTSVPVPAALKIFALALKASDMTHRIIAVDSPYEPEEEAHMICNALRERYPDFSQGLSVREDEEERADMATVWFVEFDGELNGLDLRIIKEYAEGFCDGILALRG